ncbi:dihydrolipoamide acetyltransferase family protein [Agromyces sp. SYSU T00266]|uniref:dihydrolipoamide acetyltransferase family protein n=1 Tax=Agromyces zhanjiangensis TaxID=3158562 RepID=UPI003398B43D
MATVIRMPEVLAGVTEAAVQAWLVEPGQQVAVGTPLAEVETEKAVVEYAAEAEGTVLRLLVDPGAAVAIGEPIAVIGAPGETVDDADAPEAVPVAADAADAAPDTAPDAAPATGTAADPESGAPVAEPEAGSPLAGRGEASGPASSPASDPGAAASEGPDAGTTRRFASPIVRRLAREQGIDLARLQGTGPGGRIVRRDLEAQAADAAAASSAPIAAPSQESATAPAPAAPASPAGPVEDIPLTRMRRAIARHVTESATSVPHFFLRADCRVDELLDLRRRVNEAAPVKVSLNDFVVKACAGAFADVPEANATWGESVIHRHRSADIAVAVAIDDGLLMPVVRGVDRLGLVELATTVADLVERGRSGRLRQDELEGGSFAVSNLGMYGTTEFSAIISPPHGGILAVGAARRMPVVDDEGGLTVGQVMTVTLSADHRVLDGALAARWLAAFQRRMEQPLSILL